jgi:iron(III) transport system substrate-binding protein
MHAMMRLLLPIACLLAMAAGAGAADTPELAALVKAAQQEGSLLLDGPPIDAVREALSRDFQARYGITVSYISSGSAKSAARVRAERTAERYLLDVFVSGSDTPTNSFLPSGWLAPISKALIDPEVTDPGKWRDGHLWYVDPDRTILRVLAFVTPTMAINTKLVKPGEVTRYAQLLDKQWQGKFIVKDPAVTGSGASLISYFYLNFGPGFVEKLYKAQKPFISRDPRQSAQSLAQGNYGLWLGIDQNELDRFRKLSYPIEYIIPTDGPGILSGGWGFVCLMNKPPHPNAAKLFVNWLASREGQISFSKSTLSLSLRTDIDQSWADDVNVPKPDKTYIDTYEYKFVTHDRDTAFEKVQRLLGL